METTYTWKKPASELGIPAGVSLLGLMPHMHSFGRREQMTLGPAGAGRCAAEIQQWNQLWQRFYFYAGTPPVIAADTQIQFSCTYDTVGAAAPVLPGGGPAHEISRGCWPASGT
jgi:hypothetical protein